MKKMLLFAFVAIMAIGASAQMNVWENGGLSAQYAIENVDSVTFGITSETPSSGTGKDGITPLLKIENDYWYISYDEGHTWQQEGKAKGEKGDKGDKGDTGEKGEKGDKGDKGDAMFLAFEQDGEYVYLTLPDSSKVKIAKVQDTPTVPNGDDIIEFKDLEVLLELLQSYPEIDINNDGYISYNEATNYKGTIFLSKKTNIKYFEEFKYFKGVTSCCFSGCTNLLKITLPENINTLEENCFMECSLLVNVRLPQNLVEIKQRAFFECKKMTKIDIPNNVRIIGTSAFMNTDALTSINFPENLVSLGGNMFMNTSYIKDYYYPDTIYWNTIYYPTSLKENIIPSTNERTIKTTKSVIFGENVEVIPPYMCYNAVGLTEIVIPDKVRTINSYAFYGCTNVSNVKIGLSVNYIDNNAFYGCTILKDIYCSAPTPPALKNTSVFPSTIENIYVPTECVDDYQTQWSQFADKIVGYDFE
jgi:hypothetical protein